LQRFDFHSLLGITQPTGSTKNAWEIYLYNDSDGKFINVWEWKFLGCIGDSTGNHDNSLAPPGHKKGEYRGPQQKPQARGRCGAVQRDVKVTPVALTAFHTSPVTVPIPHAPQAQATFLLGTVGWGVAGLVHIVDLLTAGRPEIWGFPLNVAEAGILILATLHRRLDAFVLIVHLVLAYVALQGTRASYDSWQNYQKVLNIHF